MSSQTNINAVLKTALSGARGAGALLLRHYGRLKKNQIHHKAANSYVTEADRLSEALILGLVRKRFPSHAVLSEECGEIPGTGFRWIVDPLDGTGNFIRNIPLFTVSIAVFRDGKPWVGVVFDPLRNEMFHALAGKGAFLNNKRIAVSKQGKLDRAMIGTAIPSKSRARLPRYVSAVYRISIRGCNIRRSGSLALDLASVAAGRLDGIWAFDQAFWDFAAGALLVEEAGGSVKQRPGKFGMDLLVSNSQLKKPLLTLFKRR